MLERNFDLVINQPSPNVDLPAAPFTVANASQEVFLVGKSIENNVEIYTLIKLDSGSIMKIDIKSFKSHIANRNFRIVECDITVNL